MLIIQLKHVFTLALGASLLTISVAQTPAAAAPHAKDPKIEAYEAAVKDLKKTDGPLTLYWSKRQVFLELPESKLGQLFQIQASFATALDSAFLHAGMPVGSQAVDTFKFERHDDAVWLVQPNMAHRWDATDPFLVGTQRSFPEAILSSFRIEQQYPTKKLLLINVTNLFHGDLFRLPEMVAQMLGGAYMLDREKTIVDHAKGFAENTVLTMRMHFMSMRGAEPNLLAQLLGLPDYGTLEDSRSAPVSIDYNIWFRNESEFRPRLADPRIGFFTEDFFSLDRFLNPDRTQRYINRWDVEKKDAAALVSEPVKAIVWTLDPSIPAAYRECIKEGVLRWNVAFDRLGFKNAIQVVDAPANDPDYDHADGRRNVIRMMVGAAAPFGAISLLRTDPISGRILNASITIDANVIRDMMQEHMRAQASFAGSRAENAKLLLSGNADRMFYTKEEQANSEFVSRMKKFGWSLEPCMNANELAEASTLAWQSLAAIPTIHLSKEEFTKRFLADMVCHELGHCLGLRHNFAGSTELSTAELANDTLTTKKGISASVMDYTPINSVAVLKGAGNFYSPTIGAYDTWAIEYGYKPMTATTTLGEKPELARIAAQSGMPGHAYLTDDDSSGDWNPYAAKFDCASDPVTFSMRTLAMIKRAELYALVNLPKAGESYSKRTAALLSVFSRMNRENRNIIRSIGGVVNTRNFKGDLGEKPTAYPVPAQIQRQARDVILQTYLSPTSFNYSPDVTTHFSMDENGQPWNAPLVEMIGTFQQRALISLMSGNLVVRIIENQAKFRQEPYTLSEHYRAISDSVFAEFPAKKPISKLRRDVQKSFVDAIISQASASPSQIDNDVRLVTANEVLHALNVIKSRQSRGGLDEITKLHLQDLQDSIVRFERRNAGLTR